MTFDLMDEHASDAYTILSSLVTPRPIAWVTTVDSQGVVNAAPFSFFNVFGSKPPMVAFAPGDRAPGEPKDTARNIIEEGQFVINMVDKEVAVAMNQTAASLPYGVSELDGLGLTLRESQVVRPPRISESPASLECEKHSIVEVGQNRLVIGIVHRVHVRDGVFDLDTMQLDVAAYQPIGRMASPSWYARCKHLFEMPRPK